MTPFSSLLLLVLKTLFSPTTWLKETKALGTLKRGFVLYCAIVISKWQMSFFLGGFYSDSVAHVDDQCFLCNPGTYVPPENAPGRRVLDCQVCPPGNLRVLSLSLIEEFLLTLRKLWKIWRSWCPDSSREINWYRRLSHLRKPRNYRTWKLLCRHHSKYFTYNFFVIYLSSQMVVFLFISSQAPIRTLILVTELASVSTTSIVMIALVPV